MHNRYEIIYAFAIAWKTFQFNGGPNRININSCSTDSFSLVVGNNDIMNDNNKSSFQNSCFFSKTNLFKLTNSTYLIDQINPLNTDICLSIKEH